METIPKIMISGTAMSLKMDIALIPTNPVAMMPSPAIITTGTIGIDGNSVLTVSPISHASIENHDTQVMIIRKTGIQMPTLPNEYLHISVKVNPSLQEM